MTEEEMKRREFLMLCGLSALSGLLGACQVEPSKTNGIVFKSTPTRQLTPAGADWSALARDLKGTLVRPESPQYQTARLLFNTRFDDIQPAAIAYCTSPADIQSCLAFVRKFGLPFATRAGGHSYAGYSTTTGVVLDVTRMNSVAVDSGTGTATIGAGARLIDVYAALAQQGLVLPAGSCATVGVAGLTLGGGVGVLGRKFGLTCDSLLSAQVVKADGKVLTCDASHDPDLFWALRGGGGGNFGVVTSFTFRVYQVATLSLFTLGWSWNDAAAVVGAWQKWAPQAPDELWSNCLLLATKDKQAGPIVRINGVYVGDVEPVNTQLQQLISQIGAAPKSRYVSSSGVLDAMMLEAGCYQKTVPECHLPIQDPQGQLQRDTTSYKSDFYTQALPREGIDAMVNAIAQRQANATLGEGGVGLDAYGGAINRIAADATAFVHRNAMFSAQYSATWNANDSGSIVTTNSAWLSSLWQAMRPHVSGTAYQNYIDPDLNDWLHAYYGANLPRLQRIKAAYDPENLFHFNQSIPPSGA